MNQTIRVRVEHQFDPEPLRRALKRLGVTQRSLASERGITHVHMSRAFNGRGASEELVEWLCVRLGVSRDEVIKQRVV